MVFLSTIILARLLLKDDFGVAGYALVVLSFLEVLSDLGVGPALIYYRDNPRAPDTAFWLNLAIGAALFVLTYLGGPWVGMFFGDPRAIPVTQALAITFPISALGHTHDILLRKDLSFSKKFIPDFVKAISKGIISIILALMGMGAWSLILGHIAGRIFGVVALWRVMPWRPHWRFDRDLARPLLSYGLNIVSVDALGILLANADYLFVGRYLGAAALGVYTVAFRFPDLLVMQFCDVISKVIFPVYAKMREEGSALRQGFLLTTRYVALVTIPMGVGMAMISRPVVLAFFTDKWIEAIPVMQAIAIYAVMLSLSYNAGDVYKAQGRPMVLTMISIFRAVVLLPALFWAVTVTRSIVAVGWVHAAVAFVAGIIELIIASRLLHTPIRVITDALRPALLAGAVMAVAVGIVMAFTAQANPWIQMALGIGTGAFTYLGVLWFFYRELVWSAVQTVRAALAQKRNRGEEKEGATL